MPKDTNTLSATKAPTVDVKKLKHNTKLLVETEQYIYAFEVVNPEFSVVKIESGDPRIKDGAITELLPLRKGELLSILWPVVHIDDDDDDDNGGEDERKLLGPVTSVVVSGGEGDDSWDYEVF